MSDTTENSRKSDGDMMVALDDHVLLGMRAAAVEVRSAMRAARKSESNVVMDLLRHEGEIILGQHYPDDNVRDPESHAQYYYHCHRPGEHGHFHCFIMGEGLPKNARPVSKQHIRLRDPNFTAPFCHLVAIGMDEYGMPVHMFTTNRWVTQEIVYPAKTVIELLDHFEIDLTTPAWSTNRWLTAMLRLFRPQIEALILERDEKYAEMIAERPRKPIWEDTDTEILSLRSIDLDTQIAAVENALDARGL